MKKHIKKIVIMAAFTAVIVMIYAFDLHHNLTWANLNASKEQLDLFVQSNYLKAMMVYIAVYIVATATSVPAASIITMAGGYMFGFIGVIYVNFGATTGATLVFLSARYIIGDYIQEKYGSRFQKFNREIEENGPNYLLTLRLIPVFPFWLVNLAPAFTRIRLLTFIWTTSLGIIPGSFAYIIVGRQLGHVEKPSDLLTWQFWAALAAFGLIALMPVLIKKIRRKNTDAGSR